MDYYEELGLKPSATVQEIRHAYKLMARLMHPDGHSDASLRDMAERQMKRLNDILATLTNEDKRRDYNAGLNASASALLGRPAGTSSAPRPPGPNTPMMSVRWWQGPHPIQPKAVSRPMRPPQWVQPVVANWFWISLTLMVLCIGAWYVAQSGSESSSSGMLAPMPDSKRPLLDESQPKRQFPRTSARHNERHEIPPPIEGEDKSLAGRQSAAEPGAQEFTQSLAPPVSYQVPLRETVNREALRDPPGTSSAVAPESLSVVTPPGVAKTHASSLAGNWLYVPDPAEKLQPGAYAATYVELLLAEEHGRLSGGYRARYRVLDHAVSQEVSFRVQGDAPSGASGNFKWTSPDGAQGEMQLALTGLNAIKITWWATKLGRHATLTSGMAKLVREQVR